MPGSSGEGAKASSNTRCPQLELWFPKLRNACYEKTSEKDADYNCIAWAAGDTRNWWWPDGDGYWPRGIVRQNEAKYFVQAFGHLGYRVCDNSRLEPAYEKVALYALDGEPRHMARQLRDGTWTSKCGTVEDINHFTLDAVECYGQCAYGAPILYMKRFIVVSWIVRLFQLVGVL